LTLRRPFKIEESIFKNLYMRIEDT